MTLGSKILLNTTDDWRGENPRSCKDSGPWPSCSTFQDLGSPSSPIIILCSYSLSHKIMMEKRSQKESWKGARASGFPLASEICWTHSPPQSQLWIPGEWRARSVSNNRFLMEARLFSWKFLSFSHTNINNRQ